MQHSACLWISSFIYCIPFQLKFDFKDVYYLTEWIVMVYVMHFLAVPLSHLQLYLHFYCIAFDKHNSFLFNKSLLIQYHRFSFLSTVSLFDILNSNMFLFSYVFFKKYKLKQKEYIFFLIQLCWSMVHAIIPLHI